MIMISLRCQVCPIADLIVSAIQCSALNAGIRMDTSGFTDFTKKLCSVASEHRTTDLKWSSDSKQPHDNQEIDDRIRNHQIYRS